MTSESAWPLAMDELHIWYAILDRDPAAVRRLRGC